MPGAAANPSIAALLASAARIDEALKGDAGARRALAELVESLRTTTRALETRESEALARQVRADSALLETLAEVRSAQDQVGNSIAVVLGWLRMIASPKTDEAVGGIQIAIRRLEETQAIVAALLRRTTEAAIAEHASDPVNVSAILREGDRERDEHPAADSDQWVLANRTHLVTFLTHAADIVDPEPVLADESWSLALRGPGLLTTALLTGLAASGGSLATDVSGQSVQWRRTSAGPAT